LSARRKVLQYGTLKTARHINDPDRIGKVQPYQRDGKSGGEKGRCPLLFHRNYFFVFIHHFGTFNTD